MTSLREAEQVRADEGVGRIHGRQGKVPQKTHGSYSAAYEKGYAKGHAQFREAEKRSRI